MVLELLEVLLPLDFHHVLENLRDLVFHVLQWVQQVLVILVDQVTLPVQLLPSGLVHLAVLEDLESQVLLHVHVVLVGLLGLVDLLDQVDLDLLNKVQNVSANAQWTLHNSNSNIIVMQYQPLQIT